MQEIRQKCRQYARDFELCIKLIMLQHASLCQ
jgi:thiamine pyrophosphokinase